MVERENNLLEVELINNSFLQVRETLNRIGIKSVDDDSNNVLNQTCYILCKKARYYIVHSKEMFALEYGKCEMEDIDILRRNKIASLLQTWKLINIIDKSFYLESSDIHDLIIVPYKSKDKWKIISQYFTGKNNEDQR